MKTDTVAAALTVRVVEMLALMAVVAMAADDSNSGQNMIGGGSGATVAMAAADSNRNCRGRQQSAKYSSSSSKDSCCGSGDCGSVVTIAGRGGSMAEVTMRAAAIVTTVVLNLYPLFLLAMAR